MLSFAVPEHSPGFCMELTVKFTTNAGKRAYTGFSDCIAEFSFGILRVSVPLYR